MANVQAQQNLTRAQCRATEFTGLREDPILRNYEIWVMGKMVKEVTEAQLAVDPMAHIKAYADAFGIDIKDIKLGDSRRR